MKVDSFRLVGIRCFDDTADIFLGRRCNIFVGQNNTAKSTLLKGLSSFQGFPFVQADLRPGFGPAWIEMTVVEIEAHFPLLTKPNGFDGRTLRAVLTRRGPFDPRGILTSTIGVGDDGLFQAQRPYHGMVVFLARRKAAKLGQEVHLGVQAPVDGTFANLVSRIDLLATFGHPRHEKFKEAVQGIIGLPITTKAAANGKEAGFHLDDNTFVTLDRMGDGVTEMVALIVELCLERNKIVILEEPETNLHPKGLKAILTLIRSASQENQFVIATHSNIVLRELGSDIETKVFRVHREGIDPAVSSTITEVPKSSVSRRELLRDLGYEFADFDLHEGWLFLEESSAERVINDILIPTFAPGLRGRLRTFSAAGVTNIEPSIEEFQRLVTFVHLQPAYKGRMWIRVDGDSAGKAAVAALREKFKYLDESSCAQFREPNFESYYPVAFQEKAAVALSLGDRQARREAKRELLAEVLNWSVGDPAARAPEWASSAQEIIEMLRIIEKVIESGSSTAGLLAH